MKKLIIKLNMLFLVLLSISSCSSDNDTVATPMATLSSISPTSGPKDTVVTIIGDNFGADLNKIQVFFNDVEAEVQSVANTKIVTKVPVRAYSGTVKIIVRDAELGGSEFTYLLSETVVTTFAGDIQGDTDGTLENAQFSGPVDGVFDSNGNLFVVDNSTHKVRKITPDGVVSTFAGSTIGYEDGIGTEAKFRTPFGIAIDANSNIYVADAGNSRIRKITPEGAVSTFAGGDSGNEDGNALDAKFSTPHAIDTDGQGNLYVTDVLNHSIRKITPDGTVSTFAGSTVGDEDGIGSNAKLNRPRGLKVDAQGNIFITDSFNNKIKKITPQAQVTTIAGDVGGNRDGNGTFALFNISLGIDVDTEGILYVADTNNHSIRKINTSGDVITYAGNGDGYEDGIGAEAKFDRPFNIILEDEYTSYVMDLNNNRIRKITQE
ncbi:gluconolactonase [Flagellimonas hymeniacidonis]|uniref:Gluconolactonase n=1 Tax=Flagellimonas hymeniacidonis TaxID=2603628 RepID=A0A5C8V1K1_9FLAO|nr:IPT/TIG domain-containing protein [Flagellimonas hymeniacidonis]TXN35211.1 gluconolactonase [Flagellimonas hymeniacidonis]